MTPSQLTQLLELLKDYRNEFNIAPPEIQESIRLVEDAIVNSY